MSISDDTALSIVQRFAEEHCWDSCSEYGEPGYSFNGDQQVVVFGNYWCECKQHPHTGQLRHRGYGEPEPIKATDLHDYATHHPLLWARLEEVAEFEWSDEWYVDYENDKAYRTTADSYGWQPSVVFDGECDMLTPDDDIDVWVEWATDDPTARIIPRHIVSKSELEAIGFSEWNGTYENGWHQGMDDDPTAIVKNITDNLGDDAEIVFWFTESSQFYIRFEALVRAPERNFLSSNAFSVDLQLADVVSYIGMNYPDEMDRLLKVYPELPRALETLVGTSCWIDPEEAGVDVEFSSWVIEHIEQHTPIMWEDGEPVETLRPWEDDSDD